MAVTQADVSYYAPVFHIKINNKDVDAEVSAIILDITIRQEIKNKISSFTFTVQDSFFEGQFRWLGDPLFKYGNIVMISMGYAGNMHTMIEGTISKISADFTSGTTPTFRVEGMDKGYEAMVKKSDTKVFREKKASEIAQEIASVVQLGTEVDETTQVFPIQTKSGGESYFDFLNELAAANNPEFKLFLSGRKLYFIEKEQDKKTIATLTWGRDLINFRPELDINKVVTKVIVRSWDRNTKNRIEGVAPRNNETVQQEDQKIAREVAREIYGEIERIITNIPVRSIEEAENRAYSELEKISDELIKASGETIGIPEIKPGEYIQVEGASDWFSGKYYIDTVEHKIDSNGYRTKFEARRNAI